MMVSRISRFRNPDLPNPSQALEQEIQREVIDLHRFFQHWFAGERELSVRGFERFTSVIADDFELIAPSGVRSNRSGLMDIIWKAHGKDPGSRIWIENIHCHPLGEQLHLATYEEWQGTDDAVRGRLSSALLRHHPDLPHSIKWLHLHETWLPG
jgi:hypothetical protein